MTLIRKQVHLDIEQAKILLAEWQAVMRLQDWFIELRIVRGAEIPDAQGRCSWVKERRSAIIQLMDPIDWPTETIEPQDMEVTLVHELLHLSCVPFDDFENGTPKEIGLEQHINAISHAMVSAKRFRGK